MALLDAWSASIGKLPCSRLHCDPETTLTKHGTD
jgi:hypothetical protein